jgi:cytochrome c553
MKQVTGKWVLTANLAALVLVAFFAVSPAFGQTGNLRFEIPYQFNLGSKVLPAGTYTFSVNKFGLAVQSESGARFGENIITWITGPAELLRDGSLVFDKANGGHILSEVWIPGSNGIFLHRIPENHGRDVLMGSGEGLNPNHAVSVSGKAAFNLTCARCHGGDGNGNKEADKFFNIGIPKLTSDEVQKKSDEELRNQIAQGNGKMPPVEVDEAGFRHRLPPQDVDAVIAYVRTLKK